MRITSHLLLVSVGLIAAGAGLTACASRDNPALDQARSQVSAVAQDPNVVRDAPTEVRRAQQSLVAAESAWDGNADEAEVTSLAYVATQRAATARETASARQAEEQVKNAEADRAKALLSTRTQEVERLKQELQGLQSSQTDRGIMITLSNVLFRTDSADLLPGAATSLDRVAAFLRAHPGVQVGVDGHTDSTGSADHNLALSQRRANAVRQALVARGVEPTRIVAQGMGETAPVASNDTADGRQLNRRVEVIVSGPGLQAPQASGAPR
jgi:outer membrane protein OmpA-like peptidoglycan-associated protein